MFNPSSLNFFLIPIGRVACAAAAAAAVPFKLFAEAVASRRWSAAAAPTRLFLSISRPTCPTNRLSERVKSERDVRRRTQLRCTRWGWCADFVTTWRFFADCWWWSVSWRFFISIGACEAAGAELCKLWFHALLPLFTETRKLDALNSPQACYKQTYY